MEELKETKNNSLIKKMFIILIILLIGVVSIDVYVRTQDTPQENKKTEITDKGDNNKDKVDESNQNNNVVNNNCDKNLYNLNNRKYEELIYDNNFNIRITTDGKAIFSVKSGAQLEQLGASQAAIDFSKSICTPADSGEVCNVQTKTLDISNVLSGKMVKLGNGLDGLGVVFVLENGTLSSFSFYDFIFNDKMTIKNNIGGLKNIRSIHETTKDGGGALYAVDNNGVEYLLNFGDVLS